MRPTFSVVLPFFDEAGFLPRTLESWLAQTRPPDEMVLVDNGSTDGSADLAKDLLGRRRPPFEVLHLAEPRPGKTAALRTACARASGSWLVFSDADTDYPPHYLDTAERLIVRSSPALAAVMALPVEGDPSRPAEILRRRLYVALSKVLRKHVFTGGYGQCLRADVFRRCGGYDERLWPYVLGDHEIMARVLRYGRSRYHPEFWCLSSPRRTDRGPVRWDVSERALYMIAPFAFHRFLFSKVLGPRFDRRGLGVGRLRSQPWKDGTR